MGKLTRIIGCLFLLSALVPASAALAVEEEKGWKAEGELGYVDTSGNTETESIIVKLNAGYAGEMWSHSLALEHYFSSDSGQTTAERYVAALQSNYHLTPRGYLFGRLAYAKDRFAGYDYRIREVAGYGRRVLDTEKLTLKLEAGPGGRHSRSTAGDKEDELILYLSGHFLWKISDTASFTEDIRAEIGEEGTQTESVTAVKVRVVEHLSMKVSYTVRDNTDPPPGNRSTDTILAATAVFDL
jgi:putative salt-induced outer membrane protein